MHRLFQLIKSNRYTQFLLSYLLLHLFWQLVLDRKLTYSWPFLTIDLVGISLGWWFVAVVENYKDMIYVLTEPPSYSLKRYKSWQKILIWLLAVLMWIPWLLILLIYLIKKSDWLRVGNRVKVLVEHKTNKHSGKSVPVHLAIWGSSGYEKFTPTVYPSVSFEDIVVNFKYGGPYASITIYLVQIRQDILALLKER